MVGTRSHLRSATKLTVGLSLDYNSPTIPGMYLKLENKEVKINLHKILT